MKRTPLVSSLSDIDNLLSNKSAPPHVFLSPEVTSLFLEKMKSMDIGYYFEFPEDGPDIFGKITKSGNVVEISDFKKNSSFKKIYSLIKYKEAS